ncbi:glycoside hydrolase family 132 protein, partial [Aulographum hederae CBS 113979]
NIHTAKSGGCTEGSYCSYACGAGYQKAQWPTAQGMTGQSVGGILCKNGKLHKTSGNQKKLCMRGTSKIDVKVVNKMGENSAVCRTDYPGTESETVPLDTQPGQSYPLTCPDGENYYIWQGKTTSAQYYVNPSGVSVSDACQWGSAGTNRGNWAPVNLGVGYSAGSGWLSIMANAPTNPDGKLNFKIHIEGDDINGECSYENGQYCDGSGCNSQGCTVAVRSGEARYVFS